MGLDAEPMEDVWERETEKLRDQLRALKKAARDVLDCGPGDGREEALRALVDA